MDCFEFDLGCWFTMVYDVFAFAYAVNVEPEHVRCKPPSKHQDCQPFGFDLATNKTNPICFRCLSMFEHFRIFQD